MSQLNQERWNQKRWAPALLLLGAVLLGGCAASNPMVSWENAPASQVDAVQRAARTENPEDALQIVRDAKGQDGPVVLTLKGILLAETSRYARAASAMHGALRRVNNENGFAAEEASLPHFRPVPKQHASGDLPAVTAERDLVKGLRRAVYRDLTNEGLLRVLKRRSVPVRYPPLYEGGTGLSLEVLRQHFGDNSLRLQLLSYRTLQDGKSTGDARSERRRRRQVAAQNLIITSILARDADRLKEGKKALEKALSSSEDGGGFDFSLQGRRRAALYLALAEYLLGQQIQAEPLPQKARRLLGSNL